MGIFRAIFGKKKSEGSDSLTPEQQIAADFYKRAKMIFWARDRSEGRVLVNEIFTYAAPRFDNAKLKDVDGDERIELRGKYDGAPIRFSIRLTFGSFGIVEMLCENWVERFKLERDLKKVPTTVDADDPFAKNDVRRVFVAKGTFFEGDDSKTAKSLRYWDRIPDELQLRILRDMESLDISSIHVSNDSITVYPGLRFNTAPDGVGYMESCAQLMAALKNLSTKDGKKRAKSPSAKPAPKHGREFTCSYCRSIFWLTETHSHCPNCGAPPSE